MRLGSYRHSFDERLQVVERRDITRVGNPDLALGLFHGADVLSGARVKLLEVVAHVHHELGDVLGAVAEGARGVFVGRAHHGVRQRVRAASLAFERSERYVGEHRNVERDTEGLGPQVVHVDHEGDAVAFCGPSHGERHIVGRNLAVDEVVVVVRIEVRRHALGHHMVRPDALGAHVGGIARLGNELHVERVHTRVERRQITLALLPVLEAARDEVDIEAPLHEKRREERVARGTLDLVAKLGIGAEYGYARFAAHGSSLGSVLVTALGDQAHDGVVREAQAVEERGHTVTLLAARPLVYVRTPQFASERPGARTPTAAVLIEQQRDVVVRVNDEVDLLAHVADGLIRKLLPARGAHLAMLTAFKVIQELHDHTVVIVPAAHVVRLAHGLVLVAHQVLVYLDIEVADGRGGHTCLDHILVVLVEGVLEQVDADTA